MKLIIAAGGTGGHLFPGISVAEFLKKRDPGGEVLFVGSGRPIERDIFGRQGVRYEMLEVGRIKGAGMIDRFKTILGLPVAVWAASRLLQRFRPDVVLGIGGYSSGPVLLAAKMKGIPGAVLEPNAIPGFTNRLLGHLVDRVFVAFEKAGSYFSIKKVRQTGTPVRASLTAIGRGRRETIEQTKSGVFTLLILGGSQGARSLNQAVVAALPQWGGGRFRIIHQTGAHDIESIRTSYKGCPLDHRVEAFLYSEELEAAYREADLAVCRAGASTMAELIETATPSLLVPYPFAADDHQSWNAMALSQEGGAEVLKDGELGRLAERVLFYAKNPERLRDMREKLLQMRKVPSAETVAQECLEMARASNA